MSEYLIAGGEWSAGVISFRYTKKEIELLI